MAADKCDSQAQMYALKQKASEHLGIKKYSWAMVYLVDTLKIFDKLVEQVENGDHMEKIIREIKIPAHKNLSLCYLKQSQYTKCIQQCQEALSIEPNCVKILYRMGLAYIHLKNFSQAEFYLKKAYMIDPNEKQVMKALSQIQQQKNKQQKVKDNPLEGINTKTLGSKLLNIIKLIVLWPFYAALAMYNGVFTQNRSKLSQNDFD